MRVTFKHQLKVKAMKKLFYTLSVAVCIIAAMSFTPENKNIGGLYTAATTGPGHMQLNLKYDHTFIYQDVSNADKHITVYGRWHDDGKYVTLKDYVTTFKLNEKWQITNSGNTVKAHIGTTFYTLQKQPGC
jgi:hypothetical protein